MLNGNLRLAIQKSGRLTDKSLQLLRTCGLDIDNYSDCLLVSSQAVDLIFKIKMPYNLNKLTSRVVLNALKNNLQ